MPLHLGSFACPHLTVKGFFFLYIAGSLNDLSDDDRREASDYLDAGTIQAADFKYLILHYAALVCQKTNRWRVRAVALHNSEPRLVELWYNRLSSDLRGTLFATPKRPALLIAHCDNGGE